MISLPQLHFSSSSHRHTPHTNTHAAVAVFSPSTRPCTPCRLPPRTQGHATLTSTLDALGSSAADYHAANDSLRAQQQADLDLSRKHAQTVRRPLSVVIVVVVVAVCFLVEMDDCLWYPHHLFCMVGIPCCDSVWCGSGSGGGYEPPPPVHAARVGSRDFRSLPHALLRMVLITIVVLMRCNDGRAYLLDDGS